MKEEMWRGVRIFQAKGSLRYLESVLFDCINTVGAIAECGVAYGGLALWMLDKFKELGITKQLHLCDTFVGMPRLGNELEKQTWKRLKMGLHIYQENLPSEDNVLKLLHHHHSKANIVIHKGLFSETLPKIKDKFCLIHGDGDLYESTKSVIEFADCCLSVGGSLVLHDYGAKRHPGIKKAIHDFIDSNRYDLKIGQSQAIFKRR